MLYGCKMTTDAVLFIQLHPALMSATYPTSYVILTEGCSSVVSPTFFLGGTLNTIFHIPRSPYR
jgi:hypothetical protein